VPCRCQRAQSRDSCIELNARRRRDVVERCPHVGAQSIDYARAPFLPNHHVAAQQNISCAAMPK
jgi:hypothetical protein